MIVDLNIHKVFRYLLFFEAVEPLLIEQSRHQESRLYPNSLYGEYLFLNVQYLCHIYVRFCSLNEKDLSHRKDENAYLLLDKYEYLPLNGLG